MARWPAAERAGSRRENAAAMLAFILFIFTYAHSLLPYHALPNMVVATVDVTARGIRLALASFESLFRSVIG